MLNSYSKIIYIFLLNVFLIHSNISGQTIINANDTQLIKFPQQWEFLIPKSVIILTSDRQLEDLLNPDEKIDVSIGIQRDFKSLRQICDEAVKSGHKTIILAFDNFFNQYRKEAGDERKLLPDSDEYIRRIKKISQFLETYDLGLELSLLSPLELGPAFQKYSGECGRWIHYKIDIRDPETGQFGVPFWQQLSWSNNKGKFNIKRTGIRAFAFKEKRLPERMYYVVKPDDIREITAGIKIEEMPGTESAPNKSYRAKRIRVYHEGDGLLKGYDRVFVLLSYESPEMDYFSPRAPVFLKQLITKYHEAGIRLNALYSDEMHIQQDWSYDSHHDDGQFALRYLTTNMAKEYAKRYGTLFEDLDKYMLYFVYGPRTFLNNIYACRNSQIVMGDRPEDIHKTFLLRNRYYKLLNNHVVDLFVEAKEHAERLYGKELLTRAHASWAESPTIDQWDVGRAGRPNDYHAKYEYTPNFIWSNTVHQAASACYDYFKWGEFLIGTGNDFAECGYADRNYYGAALACSYGILNKYPNAYAAHWGMPAQAGERRQAIASAFGAAASPTIMAVTENVHRDVDVLMLYPMSLVAAEERFGSWMTQYSYANYITAEKLLELGQVGSDGRIEIAGRSFSTLAALFEIVPQPGLLEMMHTLSMNGGNVIWSGPPPLISADGVNCLSTWETLFGVNYQPSVFQGDIAAGKVVDFRNSLANVPEQVILTDFLVDRIYPVEPSEQNEIIAVVDDEIVGVKRKNGNVYYLGFRPRDDQSQSLGREQRTWFEILHAIGAYPSTGKFKGVNDNTEYISRTTDYLATRFPNGTTVIATHYRTHKETWPGGFARNNEEDAKILKENPLPSDKIKLTDFMVNGHTVSYDGRLIVAFNINDRGKLLSFEGYDCSQIIIDGKQFKLSEYKQPHISWAPVAEIRKLKNKAFLQILVNGSGKVYIPFQTRRKNLKLYCEGSILGTKGQEIDFKNEGGLLELDINSENTNRWLYLVGDGAD